MKSEEIFYFDIARDFDALREVFVRAINQANKMSTLKAIYLLPGKTKRKCTNYECNEDSFVFNWESSTKFEAEPEQKKARFNLVFEYYSKSCYNVDLCFDCFYNQLKEYFDSRLREIKRARK